MRVFLTAQAHRDIAAIKSYIAKNNPGVAERVAKRLYEQADGLSNYPRKGTALSAKFDIQTDLRIWIVSPNLILYRITEDKIIVTRVIDGRRDYLAAIGLAERNENQDEDYT